MPGGLSSLKVLNAAIGAALCGTAGLLSRHRHDHHSRHRATVRVVAPAATPPRAPSG